MLGKRHQQINHKGSVGKLWDYLNYLTWNCITNISLEPHGKTRHVISFWTSLGKARLKPLELGVGAPHGGRAGGWPLYQIPVSKGLGPK